MRKTLTVLTVVLATASLAACKKYWEKEQATAPPVPATSTETPVPNSPAETAAVTTAATAAQPPAPATATK